MSISNRPRNRCQYNAKGRTQWKPGIMHSFCWRSMPMLPSLRISPSSRNWAIRSLRSVPPSLLLCHGTRHSLQNQPHLGSSFSCEEICRRPSHPFIKGKALRLALFGTFFRLLVENADVPALSHVRCSHWYTTM